MEVKPPEFVEVPEATVDKVDGPVYGVFVIAMELGSTDVKPPEFADVVSGELEVGAVG